MSSPPLPPKVPTLLALNLSHIIKKKKSKDDGEISEAHFVKIHPSLKETIVRILKPRQIRSMASRADTVYIAGKESDIAVFDAKAGKWTNTIPGGWQNAQVMTYLNDKIYAVCGKLFGGNGGGSLWEIDPRTKKYRSVSQRSGWKNATVMTAFGGKIYIVCGKMGGCAGGGGLWEVDMTTPPPVWSPPHEGKYLGGYAADGGTAHKTLLAAQIACMWDPTASGVTKSTNGTFTVRKNSSLKSSPSGEISWVKLSKGGYGVWTLKGKNGSWSNAIAMTHLGGRLYIICGTRGGTRGDGHIWNVDPKTGEGTKVGARGMWKKATTISAHGGHLFITCDDKLWKVNPTSGATTVVGKRNWKRVQSVANLGTSLLFFMNPKSTSSVGKGIPILGKQKLLASRGKELFMQSFVEGKMPRDWTPMDPKEGLKLVPLKDDDGMFTRIVQRVKETLPSAKIISITRVQNRSMWEEYAHTMHKMSRKNDGVICERWLFHGTRTTKPDLLFQSNNAGGFDSRLGSGFYGTGAYFAEKASYSHDWTHHTSGRRCKFFLARVLTGYSKSYGMTQATHLKRQPDLPPGHPNAPGLYDSVNGGPHRSGSCPQGSVMHIVYDKAQTYPAYLIEYEK
eukprot:g1656.t1